MKKISLSIVFALLMSAAVFAAPETTTEKIPVEGRQDAYLYVTQIYASEYWAEFFIVYEEPSKTFDAAESEKILYEFISNYKVEKKFSRVEVEDLLESQENAQLTRVTKRVIFRQIRK